MVYGFEKTTTTTAKEEKTDIEIKITNKKEKRKKKNERTYGTQAALGSFIVKHPKRISVC